MSQITPSTTPSAERQESDSPLTMADVFDRISADPALTVRGCRDMLCALRTLARVLGVSLAAIPAQPHNLRERFASACPKRFGVSPARWDNVRSLTLKALGRVGIQTLPGRSSAELTPEWERLSCLLTDTQQRCRLSRFLRFCSGQGITPGQVDAGALAAFHQALQSMSLNGKPSALYRSACLAWNSAVEDVPGWPRCPVPVPSFSRRYAMHWESFPASFVVESEAFLTHSGNQDPFADDYAPSVKPSTVAMRRKQILQIATALVHSGVGATDITGLAVLVKPENAQRALRFFRDRAGGEHTKYLHQQAVLLKTIARHWVKAPAREIETLRKFAANIAPKQTGMVEKNKAMLRQFDLPENERRLLELPDDVFSDLEKKDRVLQQDALRAMYALAVELLLAAPMRIDKLAGLELGRHLLLAGAPPPTRVAHIHIPAAENKTPQPFDALLPDRSTERLHRFLERYRPIITIGDSPFLFANGTGRRRSTIAFGRGFSAFIYQETGLRMTRHFFRHLAVRFLLEDDPNNIETARLALGHRSSTTTIRAYADRNARAALQRLGRSVEKRRQQALAPAPVPKRLDTSGGRS